MSTRTDLRLLVARFSGGFKAPSVCRMSACRLSVDLFRSESHRARLEPTSDKSPEG